MLEDTWAQYIFIRLCVFVLSWIAPTCLGYTAWTITNAWPHAPSITAFRIWCAAESVFLLFFLWYRVHLQREASHPPLRSKEDRQILFSKLQPLVHDVDKFLSGWFRGARAEDVGREDFKDFLNWAFWDGRADLSPGGVDEKELNHYTDKVETMMTKRFKPGYGSAKCLRLTLDPIEMECRTLFWYFLMGLVDFICHTLMRVHGFQYYKTLTTSLMVYPPRPATWIEPARSPAPSLSYWVRPHTSTKRLPILWIHGIGIGLIQHTKILHELDMALNSDNPDDGEVGIMAVEILQVSSRLTGAILTRGEFLEQLTSVLDYHGYTRFVMASHSYGSVLSTYILTHENLANRVSATLLLDPVTVLLHMPDVAYNFTVRPPKHANEWQLWYFASKDPGVAHTLGRHFFWTDCVLWREHILELAKSGTRITASLASDDLIVDTSAVGTYLTDGVVPDVVIEQDGDREKISLHAKTLSPASWKSTPWRGKGLEVIWWDGFDHGQVFDKESTRAKLVDVMVEYSKGT